MMLLMFNHIGLLLHYQPLMIFKLLSLLQTDILDQVVN
jgi:hypothetical protein